MISGPCTYLAGCIAMGCGVPVTSGRHGHTQEIPDDDDPHAVAYASLLGLATIVVTAAAIVAGLAWAVWSLWS